MTAPVAIRLDANGTELNVYRIGAASNPPLVMLHGMRDVAMSLMPVAQALSRHYQVYLPDLRGHGLSAQSGDYAMPHFLFDLHCLFDQLIDKPAGLFGHSLGGQIASRFAALYPDLVPAAILVEGLGPPARPSLSCAR